MNGKKIHQPIIFGSAVVILLIAMTLTGVITTSPGPDGNCNVVEDVTYWVIQQHSFDFEKERCPRIANIDRNQEKVTNYVSAFQVTYPEFSMKKYLQQRQEDVIYQLSETTYLFYSTAKLPSQDFLERLSRGNQQASL